MACPGPLLLQADNFTPPERTPWGGTQIARRFKQAFVDDPQASIGESWELSVEPSFPSRVATSDSRLADVVAATPRAWLGDEIAAQYGQTCLLVKILDAGDNLSLQVHPSWDDQALDDDESGKPETWIVLAQEQGAGIYLGFREGVDEQDVAACLARGGRLDRLMNFVPVEPGDVFQIRAGTPHAVGRGVTLLEPQAVKPGKRAVTYRFWDWNRLYDESGKLNAVSGKGRPLHIRRSLEVTNWNAPRGEAFVDYCRVDKRTNALEYECRGVVACELVTTRWYRAICVSGTGTAEAAFGAAESTLKALVCLSGEAEVRTPEGALTLKAGQSAAVPACAEILTLALSDATLYVVEERCGAC